MGMKPASLSLFGGLIFAALGLASSALDRPLILSGPAQAAEQTAQGFSTVTSGELAAMLPRKDFVFVNVHIPYEGEIAGTDAFIPYDRIGENLDKLPKDKNAKIMLYCRSGRMSEIVARELVKLGYRDVSHLSGGMAEWEESGYEIIRKQPQ